jgi:hypothetical protein
LLSWTATGDDGTVGTAGSYEIRYSTSNISESNWQLADVYENSPAPLESGRPMQQLMSGLTPGELFYIAVKARDDNANYSTISNVDTAIARYSLILGTDDSAFLVSPVNGNEVANSQPYLVVLNIDENSDNIYYFQLDDGPDFTTLLAEGSVNQMAGENTYWKVPIELSADQTYYWRAKVNDDDFSDLTSFIVTPLTHVYPNPFDPGIHETATFTELPENSNLIIMTVSGSTVKQWSNVTGGEVTWNGENEAGNIVASGTYLWYIEDTGVRGKIIVLR